MSALGRNGKRKRGATLPVSVALVALSMGVAPPALARSNCKTAPIASFEMHADGSGRIYVPVQISGQAVNLLVDTGGLLSMLTKSTVDALSLPTQAVVGKHIVMIGGTFIESTTTARNVNLGGVKKADMEFLVMPDGHLPRGVGGTLAPDVMRAYVDEFDFASGKFNLYAHEPCPGVPREWAKGPHIEIPFKLDSSGHITLTVRLDGKDVPTSLDTGSSLSILRLESAEAIFGFDDRSALLTQVGQTSLARVYKYPFHSLEFGDGGMGTVSVADPELALMSRADTGMIYGPDLILGMGILHNLHMFVDYEQQKIYATRAWPTSR